MSEYLAESCAGSHWGILLYPCRCGQDDYFPAYSNVYSREKREFTGWVCRACGVQYQDDARKEWWIVGKMWEKGGWAVGSRCNPDSILKYLEQEAWLHEHLQTRG